MNARSLSGMTERWPRWETFKCISHNSGGHQTFVTVL
jgi:hypothetical protein